MDIIHLGFEAEYFHPCSDDLELPQATVDAYENRKGDAAIFIKTATGKTYSSRGILQWFLTETATTLADHLPAKTENSAGGRRYATLPLTFPEGRFHMTTDAGATGLKSLKLIVEARGDSRKQRGLCPLITPTKGSS